MNWNIKRSVDCTNYQQQQKEEITREKERERERRWFKTNKIMT